MKQWFVVHTKPCHEETAAEQLLLQKFSIYLPRYKKIRRHARKVDEVLMPLFPRYLFVGFDVNADRWRNVNGTRGVSYLLMNNDRPLIVPEGVISNLQAQEDAEGIVPTNSLVIFTKGDKVRICEGTFEGQNAIFERLDDKERVQLLLNFLGREKIISLPAYAIEAA